MMKSFLYAFDALHLSLVVFFFLFLDRLLHSTWVLSGTFLGIPKSDEQKRNIATRQPSLASAMDKNLPPREDRQKVTSYKLLPFYVLPLLCQV